MGSVRLSAAASPREADERPRVLVVDDNAAVRASMRMQFEAAGYEVEEQADGEQAVARLEAADRAGFDVVLTDLRLPGADGLAVTDAAQRICPETPVFVMTAYATIDMAVQAVQRGARDFLQKPFAFEDLRGRVEAALAETTGSVAPPVVTPPPRASASEGFVARSPAMRDAVDLARRVAKGRTTVLITGETGTGKELIAGVIHDASDRREGPFVKVNCAALPETLLESELFGHERGAFTGAERRRIGRFEQANGGTLFLDEIGDMAAATQAKLLRVLQDQEFFRLGGTRALRTDARIVAATNQDLKRARAEGRFREDLYFRLDVVGLHLSPLRERPEDLEELLETQVVLLARELGRPITGFDEAALRRLRSHAWPGNVRELRNVIERAVLMAPGPRIREADLALETRLTDALGERGNGLTVPGVSLSSMERRLVLAALEEVGWVQKAAAELIGVSPRKLNYMIRRMRITHPSWPRNRSNDPDRSEPA